MQVHFSPLDTARVDESSPGECFLSATTSADEAGAGDVLGAGGLSPSTCSSSVGLAACSNSTTSSSTSSTAPAAVSPAGVSSSGAAPAAGAPRAYGRSTSAGSANAGNDSELDSNEGSSGDSSDTSAASFSGMMEDVLKDAFIKTDEEFSDSGLQAGLVGSTAVVALVGTHRVWIANCGEWSLCWVKSGACMHAAVHALSVHASLVQCIQGKECVQGEAPTSSDPAMLEGPAAESWWQQDGLVRPLCWAATDQSCLYFGWSPYPLCR